MTVFTIPETCPECSGPTVEKGDFLYCMNKSCPAKLFSCLKVWVKQLNILNWGDALIESLSNPDNPAATSVVDLYRMTADDLCPHVSGMKMAEKCWRSLHNVETYPLHVVLSAINISGLGQTTSASIVSAGFDTVDKVIAIGFDDLTSIQGIKSITAEKVFFGIQMRASVLKGLQDVIKITSEVCSQGMLSGLKVCVTGDVWVSRNTVKKVITDAGGWFSDSVSKDTDLLVCNDVGTKTSKIKSAEKHGTPIVDDVKFRQILDGSLQLPGRK